MEPTQEEKNDQPVEETQKEKLEIVPSKMENEQEAKLAELIDMGFDATLARQALLQTNDIEEAMNLILIMQESETFDLKSITKESMEVMPYKMVIVVRTDLKMKSGKVAAQVGHGVLAAYKLAVRQCPQEVENWERIGQMKAVVRCDSEKELMDVYFAAVKEGLPAEYICDAGRTQVEPGSKTVCAIGPAKVDRMDRVTGHLKLY